MPLAAAATLSAVPVVPAAAAPSELRQQNTADATTITTDSATLIAGEVVTVTGA
ncbi:hypothetical protein GCM10027290_12210 [Micromonospora sonneratiae]|uniref:Uncharacterized protein n=1 Tax=Micromonospora sonneratiae TaxID=1184706 RepID=A0ABW3YEU5_9ACTN